MTDLRLPQYEGRGVLSGDWPVEGDQLVVLSDRQVAAGGDVTQAEQLSPTHEALRPPVNTVSSHTRPTYGMQGFMQDQIIASHICFGGHVDVNC